MLSPMIRRLLPGLFAGMFAVCMASAASASGKDEKNYSVELPTAKLKKGKNQAPVVIKPTAPWKWNKDYPSRFSVMTKGPFKATKAKLSKKDIKVETKATVVPISIEASGAGQGEMVVEGRFSVCDGDLCKMVKEKFTVALKAE